MKRILGIAVVLSLVGALTVMAQEIKPGKVDVIDLGNDVKLELVLIPAGKFVMGSKKIPVDPFSNIEVAQPGEKELPQHEVTLTNQFYMGKYEVTQEQWFRFMGENPSWKKGRKLPVTNVSWKDCQEFIKRLNPLTDGGYRLPTEAEWEYACRAGTTTEYSFGDKITPKEPNYNDSNTREPVAVGSYKPNAFGLYDMHGNVWEWCEDLFGDYPEGAVMDPKGPKTGEYRVLRGGGSTARSSLRGDYNPTDRRRDFGFRLARTIDSKAKKEEEAKAKKEEEAKAKETQKKAAMSLQKKVEKKEDLGKGIELDLVLVPEGKFKMGSPESEKGRSNNESQHEVTLTKPYYLGKYEVTQEQWEAVMGNNPSTRTKGAKLPVTHVSWEDCQEFIKKLNAKTDGGYRLPTEAEWEYACRAGTTTAYSFGNIMRPKDANYYDSKIDEPVAVGSYKPNAFGLYDMHGNVWEWCEDWYDDYPAGTVTDPKGPAMGEDRVLRGGSFNFLELSARSSLRYNLTPADRNYIGGFRLARTADSKGSVASLTETKPDPVEKMPATGNRLVAPFSEAKNDKAIADYTRDIELDPKSAFAYNKRGFTYGKLKQYDKAIADFNRAIELDPKLAVAYNNRGNTYVELKQYNKAIADCTKAIELDPEWFMAYNNRGDAYLGLQQYDKAIADCTKAIELDPKSAVAYNNRGVAYLGLQQYEKAIPECNKAIDLDPKLAVAYSNRGNAYGELEQYEKAITNCTKAIELDPNLAEAYGHRGFAYIKLKQYDKVIADYSRAIELDPKLPFANGFRGIAYFVLQQYDKAIADFSRAIELDPKSATTYNFRGTAYLKVGKKKEAEEDFAKEKMLMGN